MYIILAKMYIRIYMEMKQYIIICGDISLDWSEAYSSGTERGHSFVQVPCQSTDVT